MIRIDNSSFSPDLSPTSAKGSPAPPNIDNGTAQIPDQVQLSHATAAIVQGRADQIAALTAIVASPDYLPSSLPVSRKLISGALSRAD